MTDLALNARAWRIADQMIDRASELGVRSHELSNGSRVIDAGVEMPGGYGAGIMIAEMCTGGMAAISITSLLIGDARVPAVQIWTDHPAVGCMAAQYAGWSISVGDYFAMGSGPARAVARVETQLFDRLAYTESSDRAVLILEGRVLPTAAVAAWVAAKAGVDPTRLTLAIAPTASIAGGIQIVARSVETGLHKMDALGFDVRRVRSAFGTAPIPPVARNDLRAIGRTNDCILYGADARFVIDADDDELASLAERLPASASSDYGTPFYDIFERYGRDFYKIDPMLFSPARVALTSTSTGRTFSAGALNPDVLARSLSD